MRNHRKTDRMLELAEQRRLPVVLFAEGGGGRPGDTDTPGRRRPRRRRPSTRWAGSAAWCRWSASCRAAASPATPPCSAAATSSSPPQDANIGMGGPAMIEGGGLGDVRPRGDRAGRRCRSPTGWSTCSWPTRRRRWRSPGATCPTSRARSTDWACADQAALRHLVPRRTGCAPTTCARVIDALADTDSVLELRRGVRPRHRHRAGPDRGPAVRPDGQQPDAPGRRHRRRRRRQGGPLPAAVRRATGCRWSPCATPRASWSDPSPSGRHRPALRRLFVTGAQPAPCRCSPWCCARRTAWGRRRWPAAALKVPLATLAWPTGEVGAMGLEGAVQARLPPGAGGGRRRRSSASAASTQMVERPTSRARRSTSRPSSSSTTSSTRPTPGGGSPACSAEHARDYSKRSGFCWLSNIPRAHLGTMKMPSASTQGPSSSLIVPLAKVL